MVLVFYKHTELKNYRAMVKEKLLATPLSSGDQQQGQLVSRECQAVTVGMPGAGRQTKLEPLTGACLRKRLQGIANSRVAQVCWGSEDATTALHGGYKANRVEISLLIFGLAILSLLYPLTSLQEEKYLLCLTGYWKYVLF